MVTFANVCVALTTVCVAYIAASVLSKKKSGPVQSKLVKQAETSQGAVYRAGYQEALVTSFAAPQVKTVYDSFQGAVKKYANEKCSGTRKRITAAGSKAEDKVKYGDYEWKTYREINSLATDFASGLVHLGAKPDDRIGIFTKNREELLVAQQACFAQSLVVVSFYETLGEESIRYVAAHSECNLAICSPEVLDKVLRIAEDKSEEKNEQDKKELEAKKAKEEAHKPKEKKEDKKESEAVEQKSEKKEAKKEDTAADQKDKKEQPKEKKLSKAEQEAEDQKKAREKARDEEQHRLSDFAYKGIKNVIVVQGEAWEQHRERAKKLGIKLHSYEDVMKLGAEKPVKATPPKPETLCTIMYTSGTTGTPKGVLITHGNLAAEIGALELLQPRGLAVCPGDFYLSYLPFAHIFERLILFALLHWGGAVGFYTGDPRNLVEDIKTLRPTVLCGVPRVFDRVQFGVLSQVEKQGAVLKALFGGVVALRRADLLGGPLALIGRVMKAPADRILFGKVRAGFGNRLRIIISAGAPLSPELEGFMRVVFGCAVSQAYGLTETCGASTFKMLTDPQVGTLGIPLACNECKLVDVPDMGYKSSNTPPAGELWIRGANVSQGYYKDDEKTTESWKDGWFMTGDIGQWNPDGTLSIIDRKKNMFKLAQGEYVAAEKVEGKLKDKCSEISQIMIYGDSTKNNLVALVVLEGGKQANADDLQKKLASAGKAAGLQTFEIPTKVHVCKDAFTPENDQITPTMKLKRDVIKKAYQKEIDQMYGKK